MLRFLIVGVLLAVPSWSASLSNELHPVLHEERFNIPIDPDDPEFNCPPNAEQLSPCVCKQQCEGCNAVIHCFNITNVDTLNEVFEKTGDYPFASARFYDMTIPFFPAAAIEKKKFKRLVIANSTLVSLFDEAPSTSNILQVLYLQNIQLQRSVEWELISNFEKLVNIEIQDTTVSKISDLAGDKLPKQMTGIYLDRTQTKTIADNAFAPLSKLEIVHIGESEVKDIKRSMFPSPFIGTQISLWDNKIEELPEDFLANMPKVNSLNLQNNSLTTVSEAVFGDHPVSLRYISVEGNPINCDCEMKWMTEREMIYIEGECVAPDQNKGKALHELKKSDFAYCG